MVIFQVYLELVNVTMELKTCGKPPFLVRDRQQLSDRIVDEGVDRLPLS